MRALGSEYLRSCYFFGLDLSKLDQTWSNLIKLDQIWFPHQSKNVSIKICHIYRKDKNGSFVFDFFFNQICPKWIKLDQIGFSQQSKNVTIKSCHIYWKDKNGCFILIFLGSDPPKMDQTWSNWISRQSKNVTIKSCHIYKNGCFILDFFWSDLSKLELDQTWSN